VENNLRTEIQLDFIYGFFCAVRVTRFSSITKRAMYIYLDT